jgi:small subunit ribosomal protein S6
MNKTRQYELVYLLSPEAGEDVAKDLRAQIEATVSRYGGELARTDEWGRRKLAYPIGPHKEGVYILDLINGSGELMKELERRLRVNEQVLRYLVVRVDEELRAAQRARARRKADERPRIARPPSGDEETPERPGGEPGDEEPGETEA